MAAKRQTDTVGAKQAHYRGRDASAGVSEIIGAVLLIMLVVAVVGLIAVYLFSQQTPSKVPNLKFMTGVDSTKTTLYLYHNGGDSMNSGEFSVLLDGKPAAYTISDGGTVWSLGKNLVIPITGVPNTIQLVYNTTSSGGSVVISQAAVNVVSSQNVTPDELPYLDCSAVRNWDCADQIPPEIVIAQYMKNTTTKKINFMQFGQDRGAVIGGTRNHFNFTVAKDNSKIFLGDDQCTGPITYALKASDQVGITFTSDPDWFTVYGQAPQIWEIVGGGSSRITITITNTSGKYVITGQSICDAYIEEYSNLDSTIDIQTVAGGGYKGAMTGFIVNNTQYTHEYTKTTYKLVNFQPIGNGLFLVTYGGNQAPIYVIGWADEIWIDSVQQTGLGL